MNLIIFNVERVYGKCVKNMEMLISHNVFDDLGRLNGAIKPAINCKPLSGSGSWRQGRERLNGNPSLSLSGKKLATWVALPLIWFYHVLSSALQQQRIEEINDIDMRIASETC